MKYTVKMSIEISRHSIKYRASFLSPTSLLSIEIHLVMVNMTGAGLKCAPVLFENFENDENPIKRINIWLK